MSHKKAHEVDRWLARPDPSISIVLLYGPDHGLVAERARRFADSVGLPPDDPFAVVRLDGDAIEADPGRLADEASTISMFGGRRLLWVRNVGAQKRVAEAVRHLCERPSHDTLVLIEAADLKKGAGLRAIVEAAQSAIALPCYQDEGRSVDELIDQVLGPQDLAIDPEARQRLRQSLGGDRLASRAEIDKLALYCRGRRSISVEDVAAIVGDASATTVDDVVDGVLTGEPAIVDAAFVKAVAGGVNPYQALAVLMRQVQALELMRGSVDRDGRSAAAVVASARPPIFFKRRELVEKALGRLDAETLRRMADRLASAIAETRRTPALAVPCTRQALLAVAVESARAPRRSGA